MQSSVPAPAPSAAPPPPPASPFSASAVAARRALRARSAAAALEAPGGVRRRGGENGNALDLRRQSAAKESSRLFSSLWLEGWYSELAAHRQRLGRARGERDRERVRVERKRREGREEKGMIEIRFRPFCFTTSALSFF